MWLVHVRRGECWLAVLALGTHHLLFWCLTQHFSARTGEYRIFKVPLSSERSFFKALTWTIHCCHLFVCANNFLDKSYNSHFVVRVERLHEREHLWFFSWLFNLFPVFISLWMKNWKLQLLKFNFNQTNEKTKTLKNTFYFNSALVWNLEVTVSKDFKKRMEDMNRCDSTCEFQLDDVNHYKWK